MYSFADLMAAEVSKLGFSPERIALSHFYPPLKGSASIQIGPLNYPSSMHTFNDWHRQRNKGPLLCLNLDNSERVFQL
jgi:hypothetical protein